MSIPSARIIIISKASMHNLASPMAYACTRYCPNIIIRHMAIYLISDNPEKMIHGTAPIIMAAIVSQ